MVVSCHPCHPCLLPYGHGLLVLVLVLVCHVCQLVHLGLRLCRQQK